MARPFFLLLYCMMLAFPGLAESIQGEVSDLSDRKAMEHVTIVNVHENLSTLTAADGKFTIAAREGELLEFRKIGYKTVRLRLPKGELPPYFKIMMQKGPVELPEFEIRDRYRDYHKDSVKYRELYKNALDFPELNGLDVIRHPFSALSKRNRQIWAFQEEYTRFEQQKYIDYTFSDQLISNLTGLSGDSAQAYIKRFRPSYELLRNMNEYALYSYIKRTVADFRSGRRFRMGTTRGSH